MTGCNGVFIISTVFCFEKPRPGNPCGAWAAIDASPGLAKRFLVGSIKRGLWMGQGETIRLNVRYYRERPIAGCLGLLPLSTQSGLNLAAILAVI
jgi:hypothetical protein